MQRPRQGGIENGPSRRRVPGGTPFFERTFHEIAIEFCSEPVQKAADKKWHRQTNKHTDGQTDLADPELLRGHVLDSQNAYTSRKCLKNLSPKRPLNPANIPVNHFRVIAGNTRAHLGRISLGRGAQNGTSFTSRLP